MLLAVAGILVLCGLLLALQRWYFVRIVRTLQEERQVLLLKIEGLEKQQWKQP